MVTTAAHPENIRVNALTSMNLGTVTATRDDRPPTEMDMPPTADENALQRGSTVDLTEKTQ